MERRHEHHNILLDDPPCRSVKRRAETVRARCVASVHRFQGFQCFLLGERSREFACWLMLILEQAADVEVPHRGPRLPYDCAEVVRQSLQIPLMGGDGCPLDLNDPGNYGKEETVSYSGTNTRA